MGMTSKRLYRDKVELFIFFIIAAGVLFQSSCATLDVAPKGPEAAVSEEKTLKPMVFQSEEYVVCKLEGGETSVALAERYLRDREKSWVIEDANEDIPFEKDQMIVIPLKEENKGGLSVDGYQVVPILCYHHFAENCKSPLCAPTHILDQQMRYLKDNHYRVISLSELLDFLNYRHAIPKRSVLITIDDGYRSAYNIAYPILKKYGFTATLFIYTNFVGVSKNAITWDQLREMKADGFEIESHTISHCDLTKKMKGEATKAYMERIKKELFVSKQILDEKLEQDTIGLAFPYGRYNQRVLNMCDEAGYRLSLSVRRGGNPFFTDPLTLKRNQVLKRDMESFITNLKTFYQLSLR